MNPYSRSDEDLASKLTAHVSNFVVGRKICQLSSIVQWLFTPIFTWQLKPHPPAVCSVCCRRNTYFLSSFSICVCVSINENGFLFQTSKLRDIIFRENVNLLTIWLRPFLKLPVRYAGSFSSAKWVLIKGLIARLKCVHPEVCPTNAWNLTRKCYTVGNPLAKLCPIGEKLFLIS